VSALPRAADAARPSGAPTGGAPARRRRAARGRARRREALAGYVFLAPFLALFGAFTLWPLVTALWLSLHSYDLFSPPAWVGLENYRFLLRDGDFWISIRNTALYTAVVVAAQTALAILLAVSVDRALGGRALFRAALFLPSVTSSVATALVFMLMFFENGVLNQALASTRLDRLLALAGVATPVDWLGDPRTALAAIMVLNVWSSAGFFMVVVLAGLQAIPEALYEAARVDGAGPAQTFWRITLPALRPVVFYVVTVGLIGSFQVFDQIYVMTEGGPLKSTLTTAYLIYREAFVNFEMGYACAIAFVLAAVIFACAMVQKRVIGA
jgi:multiple sugar transport system permease protein